MNRTIITAAILLTVTGLLAGCRSDSSVREVAVRNSCDTAVQIASGDAESNLPLVQTRDVPAGETISLGATGDLNTIYNRWGPTGVELDDSLPVFSYEPNELIAATAEEEDEGGYQFYFVIEGSACP